MGAAVLAVDDGETMFAGATVLVGLVEDEEIVKERGCVSSTS